MGSVVRGGADLFFDDRVSFLETIISRGRQARRSGLGRLARGRASRGSASGVGACVPLHRARRSRVA